MRVSNVIANFFGRFWSILLLVALTPFYIKTLGYESYGLIGFFGTVQSIATLFELGLPMALNKAVARFTAQSIEASEVCSLIKAFERFFTCVAICLCVVALPVSYFLSTTWFEVATLPTDKVTYSLCCIFVLVSLRFPIGLYLAVLAGMQQQVKMNVINVLSVSARLGFAAAAIVLWEPDILIFFGVQVLTSAIELVVMRAIAWRSHGDFRADTLISWDAVWRHSRFAINVGVITVLGIILLQLDKVLVSGLLPLEQFGYYSLITMIGGGLITLGYPVATASYPHFVELISLEKSEELEKQFFKYLKLVILVVLPISIPLTILSNQTLVFYAQNSEFTDIEFSAFTVFLAAAFFGSIRSVCFGLILGFGRQRLIIKYYTVLLPIYSLLLYIFIVHFNLFGAALCFLLMQIVSAIVFLSISMASLNTATPVQSLSKLVVMPYFFCFLFAFLVTHTLSLQTSGHHVIVNLMFLYFSCVGALVFLIFSGVERRNFIDAALRRVGLYFDRDLFDRD